ncbi:MAG TPA: 3',5'-cyclic-nucleotide phosphodiesterase [Noviherbaspirillum sp.]|jgi:3',5'-cyclic-nucleotide phosphodiesterase|uniref:3',5'-cyclic-nucleotide phosphodiesterase n=1 Tax=Noviherbaspirillum sp. TaxID=1926288 RepID=UPI002F9573CA
MKLQVLGCAGGIGGQEGHTTSLLVDDDILLDAGTGLAALDLDRLVRIDHVFITHSHLDHVAGLAFLLDAVLGKRTGPVTVHASGMVIAALRRHLFNWVLWPDFGMIPDEAAPVLRWSETAAGVPVTLGDRTLVAHPVNHTVGSSAWWVHNDRSGFLFTGDMASTPALWSTMSEERRLRKVIVDCSFANADRDIADRSLHFCPASLLEDIRSLPDAVEVLIYHLKPGHEELIMRELRQHSGPRGFTALRRGDTFEF